MQDSLQKTGIHGSRNPKKYTDVCGETWKSENPAEIRRDVIFSVCTWLQLLQNRGTMDVDGLVWTLIPDVPVWQ